LTVLYKNAKADAASNEDDPGAFLTGAALVNSLKNAEPQLAGDLAAGAVADKGQYRVCTGDAPSDASTLRLIGGSKSGKLFLLQASNSGLTLARGNCDGFSDTASTGGPPATTDAVSITGPGGTDALETGATLTAATGTWTGSPTFTYQWQRCESLTQNPCLPISGATAQTYTTIPTDGAFFIQVVVTATNGAGSISKTSSPVTLQTLPAPAAGTAQIMTASGNWVSGTSILAGQDSTVYSGTTGYAPFTSNTPIGGGKVNYVRVQGLVGNNSNSPAPVVLVKRTTGVTWVADTTQSALPAVGAQAGQDSSVALGNDVDVPYDSGWVKLDTPLTLSQALSEGVGFGADGGKAFVRRGVKISFGYTTAPV
jgi:hypothetical protein